MSAGPKVKISRALNLAITPKAARIMERRSFTPGQHGLARKKSPSTYKLQLLEKQRLKATYNVSEKQMRTYYAKASHSHESTGTVLLSYLETRADAAIFRMGFARTIYAARQYVAHGHFSINGKRIFTPSHQLKVGDVIAVQEKSKNHPQLIEALTHSGGIQVPEYYEINKVKMEGKLIAKPIREQIPVKLAEQHVVEYYSR
jgi:small subunit ribosomal protein S4